MIQRYRDIYVQITILILNSMKSQLYLVLWLSLCREKSFNYFSAHAVKIPGQCSQIEAI